MHLCTKSVGLSQFRSMRYCGMEYPLKPCWLVASSLGGCFCWLGCQPRCSAWCVQGWLSCCIFFYWLRQGVSLWEIPNMRSGRGGPLGGVKSYFCQSKISIQIYIYRPKMEGAGSASTSKFTAE